MQFIDIHGHYAWNIDDGIANLEDAKKALEIAKQNNITTIVATPHVIPGTHSRDDILRFQKRISELKQLARSYQIQVFEGCELFLNHDCLDALNQGILIPFENTDYLLVEFDVRKELPAEYEVEDFLYEIALKGYKPILAHVERYFKEEVDIDRVKQFQEDGYVIQVNASSLLGVHGKTVKNNAYTLLENGLAQVIATDTHRCNGQRIPCLQDVCDLLSKKYDYQTLKILMYDNPAHILHNEEVENIPINRSFFKKLFKRR